MTMCHRKEHPRYNIISVRTSDEEAEQIDRIIRQGGAENRSEILRMALDSFFASFDREATA